jgi:hypothetical protein
VNQIVPRGTIFGSEPRPADFLPRFTAIHKSFALAC